MQCLAIQKQSVKLKLYVSCDPESPPGTQSRELTHMCYRGMFKNLHCSITSNSNLLFSEYLRNNNFLRHNQNCKNNCQHIYSVKNKRSSF